jgi:hypothetical protein
MDDLVCPGLRWLLRIHISEVEIGLGGLGLDDIVDPHHLGVAFNGGIVIGVAEHGFVS